MSGFHTLIDVGTVSEEIRRKALFALTLTSCRGDTFLIRRTNSIVALFQSFKNY